jgi:hypothetical protein
MVVMTAIAMVSTGVILAALLIRLVPMKESGSTGVTSSKVSKSANGYVTGELLVKFAANSTQLSRTQALQKALEKPVNVTTLTSVKKRQGLRTVTQTAESISQRVASIQSIHPVIPTTIQLTATTYETRAKRGTAADLGSAANALRQWYVVKVTPATADVNQIATILRKQAGVEKVETDRRVSVAATRSVSSTNAGAAIKLAGAQMITSPAAGDCNLDTLVDGKDLRVLVNYLYSSGPAPKSLLAADVNHDGEVDVGDVTALVDALYAKLTVGYADLTGDGKYNDDDMNFLSAYLFQSGPAPSPLSIADYDKDGNVDITDLTMSVNVLYGPNSLGTLQYGRGDANADGVVDQRDLDFLIAFLFTGGPGPNPIGLADMDLDGVLDVTDLTYLVSLLYDGPEDGVTAALVKSPSSVQVLAPIADSDGGTVQSIVAPTYLLGDSNGDGRVTMSDLQFLVSYLYKQGQAPSPLSRADFDFDGTVDVADLIRMVGMVYEQLRARAALADLNADGAVNNADLDYIVNYLFKGGPAPDLAKADVDGDGNVNIADVTVLSMFVYKLTTPPPCSDIRGLGTTTFLNGDVNANGSVTKADLSALASIVYNKAALPSPKERADVDCDSNVTPLDVLALDTKLNGTNVAIALPGDANSDGAVNPADLVASIDSPTDINRDGKENILDTYDLVRLLNLTKPSKLLPDLNADGKVDWADADVIVNGIFAKSTLVPAADVNGDGASDIADAYAYVKTLKDQGSVSAVLAGDVNVDGLVDCRDVKYLNATYFKKGPATSSGARADVNSDGKQNVADVLILAKRTCPGIGGGTLASDVRIAVLDSGIRPLVELQGVVAPTKELPNKLDNDRNGYVADVQGWNTLNRTSVITDCQGHGTALAKMLAAKTGVSPLAKVIPIRVVDCKGNGTALSLTDGLVYATVRGADIALMPVSGVGTSVLLADVVRYAKAAGMLVVGAAGNDAAPMTRVVPANVSGVVSVGATTSNGKALAPYTNTGSHVSAPGAAEGVPFEGTSVSATYVAGTAALALMKNPALTLKALEAKLIPKTPAVSLKSGKLLDALKAVQ